MQLKNKELQIIEESLNLKIQFHKDEIELIKNETDYYEDKVEKFKKFKQFSTNHSTVESLKDKDIQKELDKIKEIEELKENLFLSDSCLLLISNKVNLNLSN